MKAYFHPVNILLLGIACSLLACGTEDDAIEPAEKYFIEGNYLMNDFDLHAYDDREDTTIRVASKPIVEFKERKSAKETEVQINLRELIEKTVKEVYPTLSVSVQEFDPLTIEKQSGSKFLIKEFEFEIALTYGTHTVIYPFTFKSEGIFSQDKCILNFIMSFHDPALPALGTAYLEGSTEGRKIR